MKAFKGFIAVVLLSIIMETIGLVPIQESHVHIPHNTFPQQVVMRAVAVSTSTTGIGMVFFT